MFASGAFAALVGTMAVVSLVAVYPRVGVWRRGRAARVDWLNGLWALPRRYLVDVHNLVAREPDAAQMHAWTAGGLLSGSVMALLGALPGLSESRSWWGLDELCFAVMLRGALVEVRRRRRSSRLPQGRFRRLPALLIGYGLGGLGLAVCAMVQASPMTTAAPLALAAFCGLTLAVDAGRGPMRHAFAGALYLAAHPRPERFGGGRSVALAAPGDFAWNERVGFDACVQCGRCEAACPAVAAGQTLNPRTLIQSLAAGAETIPAEALWACTTCRACVEECPVTIEIVDAIIGLRRRQPMTMGAAHAQAEREGLRVLAPGEMTDVLLWLNPGEDVDALARLLQAAGVDFAVLGARDCGDGARRLGDEATFVQRARETVAELAAVGFNKILTRDPHALNCLRNEYPTFGGTYEVWHHTAFLDALIEEGRLTLGRLEGGVTYHDPCYLARYNGETQAPRRLLDALGLERVEMETHGLRASCCGGGGGAALAGVADLRRAEAAATGAPTLAVACPNCALMLTSATGEGPQVRDIAELALAALR